MELKIYRNIIKHQQIYLLIFLFIILGLPLLFNQIQDKPFLMGAESYYHLQSAQEVDANNFYYYGLYYLENKFYNFGLALIPIFFAFASLIIFFQIAKKIKLPLKFTFFLSLFIIISPSFIFAHLTISASSLFLFLILSATLLLLQKKRFFHYFAIIPFICATFIDIFSTLFVFFLQILYFLKQKKDQKQFSYSLLTITGIFFLFNWLILQRPFFLGPFHPQTILADLISDLGGLSGISFFIFLLALIGLTITWKKKKFNVAYLFLPLLIPVYVLNTGTILFISIVTIFFATRGFLELLKRKWALNNLKKFTIFLLILGIIFSSFTYLERISAYEPSAANQETLAWIKFNTESEQIVYSTPENSAFIGYFAQREAFSKFSQNKNISQQILSSIYIQELFPLLEENEISLLYLTPKMKADLPADQGLLFLLKNERFKLLHTHEDFEVWEFNLNE